MTDFTEKIRRKGKAEEDIYFAEQERKLIASLHEKQSKALDQETGQNSKPGQAEDAKR